MASLARPAAERGFTLIEAMMAVAVTAVLAAVAVPSYADFAARHRLAAASDRLVQEMQRTRLEAVQRAMPQYMSIRPGADWCYAVSAQPGCDCKITTGPSAACAVRRGDATEFPGVRIAAARDVAFEPQYGRAAAGPAAELAVARRYATQVQMHGSGRAHVCAADAPMPGLKECAP